MSPNAVTYDELLSVIQCAEFFDNGQVTICILTTNYNFQIIGTSGTINTDNFDSELGNKYAFTDAVNQLFRFEAYAKGREFWKGKELPKPNTFKTAITLLRVKDLEKRGYLE